MSLKQTKLTSVKVLEHLYNKFKINTVDSDMTLQRLTNRTMYLYITDEDFRKKVSESNELVVSGSCF